MKSTMEDSMSTALLPNPWHKDHIAIKVTGNGNCLYNSVSMCLKGKVIIINGLDDSDIYFSEIVGESLFKKK
jgi:hypothetical protein